MSETMTVDARSIAERARAWWQDLQPTKANGEPSPSGDRAALARLRRAGTPADAMVEEATLALFRRLGLSAADRNRLPQVALIAMVLAHVREDLTTDHRGRPLSAAGRVGRDPEKPEDTDSALMKPLRLRRLLACRDDEDLGREMRRLVALANFRINVGNLAASLFFWGDKVRQRWAFEYYAAGAAAPRDDEPKPALADASPA